MRTTTVSKRLPKARASKACTSCHARKVRCDVIQQGLPCTSCQLHGFECALVERKPRGVRKPGNWQETTDNSQPRSLPEHVLLYQVPHYSFLRRFIPDIRITPRVGDDQSGVCFPIPMHDSCTFSPVFLSNISSEEMSLLKKADIFNLPPKDHLDECLSAYFRYFHSFFPIIDRQSFLNNYYTCSRDGLLDGRKISLLLLYAVMSTACPYLSLQTIKQMGFIDHREARSSFHKRARLLYSLDREPDDMTATQGLLLMSQYYPSADEQRHTWLWAYQAIGLAQGLGMHRVGKIGAQKKLWGRIWWACVVRDRLIALGTGRPMHINTLDCNIPVPDHSDLEEVGDDDEQRSIKAVYIDLLRLCQCAEGVLSLSTAASGHDIDQVELCERMLQRWVSNVTPTVGPPHESYPDLGKQSIAIMYRIILELTLNTILISLDERRYTESHYLPSLKTRLVASDSVRLLGSLIELDLIKFLPTQSVTIILPPLITQISLMWEPEDIAGYETAKKGFQCCMECLQGLAGTFWHASFYHSLFELAAEQVNAKFCRNLEIYDQPSPPDENSGTCLDTAGQSFETDGTLGNDIQHQGSSLEEFRGALAYQGPLNHMINTVLPDQETLYDWMNNIKSFAH